LVRHRTTQNSMKCPVSAPSTDTFTGTLGKLLSFYCKGVK
jgi:hypothetical protein